MPIRRGEEFLESLRDGRRVWLRGELVKDITAHPSLRGCARSVAAVYDLQHVAAYQDLLTMPSPVTGQPVSLAYLLPHSVADLTRQRKMYEFLDRFVTVALPRVRDFRGISGRAFDGRGNYNIGVKEQIIFPEIEYDKIDKLRGMEITIVTTSRNDEHARAMLRFLGMPFRKEA